MKQLLITLAFIVLAAFIVNNFILGSNSLKTEGTNIGNKMITEIQSVLTK